MATDEGVTSIQDCYPLTAIRHRTQEPGPFPAKVKGRPSQLDEIASTPVAVVKDYLIDGGMVRIWTDGATFAP